MKWSSSRWILVVAIALLFISTCLKPILNYLGYWNVFFPAQAVEKITVPDYNKVTQTFVSAPVQQIKASVPAPQQDIDISFKFKANSIHQYPENIIKTADNNGINVVVKSDGLPVLMIGTGKQDKYIISNFDKLNPLVAGKWYSVCIHAWNRHRVIVWLDHVRTVDIQSSDINFDLSHIQLGTALNYSETKPNLFDGQVKNFTLTYNAINIDYAYRIYLCSKILCIIGIFLLIFFFRWWSEQPALTKNEKIEWFSIALLISFVAMMTYHFIVSIYFPEHFYTFIYGDRSAPFADSIITLWYGLNPYVTSIPAGYFPFAYLFFYPFYLVSGAALPIMLTLFTGSVIIFVIYFFRLEVFEKNTTILTNNIKNIFIISFLSYPFWFTFERGNMEYFIFIFFALFLYFYQKKMFYRAAFMIACAGAMKAYPLLFVLLFIADRQYRAAIFCVFMTVILTLVALSLFHGGIVQNFHLISNVVMNNQKMTVRFNVYYYSLSLFLLLYKALQYFGISISHFYAYYYSAVFALLVLLTFYIVFIKQALWKKTFLIVAAMLLFPPFSAHYKLMYLFLPLALFFNEKNVDYDQKDVSYLIMFILLFIPINYGYTENSAREFFGAISNAIDPFVLIIGSIAIIISGLRTKRNLEIFL